MRTVWKEALEAWVAGSGHLIAHPEVPAGARVVKVDEQHGIVCAWFECDSTAPPANIEVALVPTGGQIPEGFEHLSTFLAEGGHHVWHAFVRP